MKMPTKTWFETCSVTAALGAFLLCANLSAEAQPAPGFVKQIPLLLKTAHVTQPGKPSVTIVLKAADVAQLFPADPKSRGKAEFTAVLADGSRLFLATLAPGGQSSLKVDTPNLRISDMEEISPDGEFATGRGAPNLVGLPIIDKTLRLNPMTMDEGYINTLTYLELLNAFRLLPPSKVPLRGEYAKVTYRFVDDHDRWTRAKHPATGKPFEKIAAGLHLANFHPVKYLKRLDSDDVEILAVARSRYNAYNRLDRAKKFFGRAEAVPPEELFTSDDVKTEPVCPFRVEIKWAKKTKAEKDLKLADKELEHGKLMQALLIKAYAAPKKYSGADLVRELNAALDLPQLFRFMALNRLLENGDISDEFFWYAEKRKGADDARLGIMPQDGDDMFRGAHLAPTTPKQLGLILKGTGLAKKFGLGYGYIMNYEDPLFRAVHDDAALFYEYLQVFEKVAVEIVEGKVLPNIFAGIATRIEPFARDADVLDRGLTDARGEEYTPESFRTAIDSLQSRIRLNAEDALIKLRGVPGKPGDLEKARKAASR
jgi:hypothetical protein